MTDLRAMGGLTRGAATQRTTGALRDPAPGGCGCLMTFHRAAPTDAWAALPNRNFYVDLGYLDRLLAHLARTGQAVVTMEEVTARAARSAPGHRYVNFSVDDGYRDTIEHVVPLFRRHGVPITVFVTTGIPDGTLSLWRSGLEIILCESETVLLDGRRVDVTSPERKSRAYGRITAAWDGLHAESSYAAFRVANGWDIDDLHQTYAVSWEMLEGVADDPCVEIGAHTASHFAFPYGRAADCGDEGFRDRTPSRIRRRFEHPEGARPRRARPLRLAAQHTQRLAPPSRLRQGAPHRPDRLASRIVRRV